MIEFFFGLTWTWTLNFNLNSKSNHICTGACLYTKLVDSLYTRLVNRFRFRFIHVLNFHSHSYRGTQNPSPHKYFLHITYIWDRVKLVSLVHSLSPTVSPLSWRSAFSGRISFSLTIRTPIAEARTQFVSNPCYWLLKKRSRNGMPSSRSQPWKWSGFYSQWWCWAAYEEIHLHH